MAEFSENPGNVRGRMSAAGHKILKHKHGSERVQGRNQPHPGRASLSRTDLTKCLCILENLRSRLNKCLTELHSRLVTTLGRNGRIPVPPTGLCEHLNVFTPTSVHFHVRPKPRTRPLIVSIINTNRHSLA